mmetsp:Transcript_32810/g.83279  ORF Transcript_32810/g.83279 Transcript_32810/m.83279 type:complete len:385 (-) Transcript_32810:114-1268(-)
MHPQQTRHVHQVQHMRTTASALPCMRPGPACLGCALPAHSLLPELLCDGAHDGSERRQAHGLAGALRRWRRCARPLLLLLQRLKDGRARLGRARERRVQRHLAQQGHAHVGAHARGAPLAGREHLRVSHQLLQVGELRAQRLHHARRHVLPAAAGAALCAVREAQAGRALLQARHVLHHPQHAHAHLAAKVDLLTHVDDGHLLRGGDDDGAVRLRARAQALRDGDVLVGGAGRCVHHQVVQLAPVHVLEELLDQPVLARSAPDDRLVRVGQHEADGHDGQVVLHVHGRPAHSALVHLLPLQPQHLGYTGPADVDVEQAHLLALRCERKRELRRERRLAHPALARQHQDLVLHRRHARAYGHQVWIWAFWCCSTCSLVWAPCTCC